MLENIMKLTPDEVIILNELVSVAKEAKEVAELIHSTYSHSFGIGEERIEVWNDKYNCEYITQEGVWQARYLHQTYDVKCSVEEIYKYFRAEYLVTNRFVEEYESNGNGYTEEGEMRNICRYFRSFVKRIQKS